MRSLFLAMRRPATPATWRPTLAGAVLTSYYLLLGLIIGTTGVLWDALQEGLRLSDALFGTAVLMTPLAGLGILLIIGQLTAWAGKRRLAIASAAIIAVAEIALALAGGVWVFFAVRLLIGVGYGLLEGSINGAALDWEHATGRGLMNPMHGAFNGAAVLGSLLAGALLGAFWSYQAILLALGLLALLLCAGSLPVAFPPQAARQPDTTGDHRATLTLLRRQPGVLALAAVCLLGAMSEGLAGVWSVIHLRDLGASLFLSGAAFALFNGAMFAGRLANTLIVARWGATVSLGLSGAGTLIAAALLAQPSVVAAVAAFAVLGLAVAGVIPTVLSDAARRAPGQTTTVAGVMMTAAFVGFAIAPFATGWAAGGFGLQRALVATLGIAGLVMLWLVRAAHQRAGQMRKT
jgi:MFS family permease